MFDMQGLTRLAFTLALTIDQFWRLIMKISERKLTELTTRIHETQLQINKMITIHQQDILILTNLAKELRATDNDYRKTAEHQKLEMLDPRFYMWENIGEGG
jgi:hypothetical protein